MKNITVFGSSKDNLNKIFYEEVNLLMKNIDKTKFNMVYGGGSQGLMGIVRKSFNGTIISSNLYKFKDDIYKDDYLFDNINDRQQKMIELGDMYLVLPGGYGTHYEALDVMTKNDINEFNKQIFILNTNNVFNKLIENINELYNNGFITHTIQDINVNILSNPIDLANLINSSY
jgi:uncharacterized protein (TIGR00730 family)